ncbi:transmembrane protein, putative (macronuclear) [Tetrahymena thermophila SB210]|uniref:Transmembrane protein, putative n=1 Tax=Tetrahymena thermophila (strain SB210) TaxID=312017 RepID=I7M9U5_TETTS|nr:transmembrane protein, putative [Tetrahymena thermophila SB210]EAS02833.1 transmembrane protein, putative [Tetrahymena thermophila SB210]|eukprot:XP_001023078.1 transmembrane protein, putative [Tetrahymena thermophila SB210]
MDFIFLNFFPFIICLYISQILNRSRMFFLEKLRLHVQGELLRIINFMTGIMVIECNKNNSKLI